MHYVEAVEHQVLLSARMQDPADLQFPIPEGAFLAERRGREGRGQIALHIELADVWKHVRMYAYIATIKRDREQYNTRSPFTCQVVCKLNFWDQEADCEEAVLRPHKRTLS